MASFFSKLFGFGKSKEAGNAEDAIRKAVDGILDYGNFDLTYTLTTTSEGGLLVDFTGPDAEILTSKGGLVIDSFQTYLKRLLQNRFPGESSEITVDCDGFLDDTAKELRELADKLKSLVLEKGHPSYVRALPPRERKIVHRHLASDDRIKSQSVGDGFCKKIKIYQVRTRETESFV